jgi:hypothetical protein
MADPLRKVQVGQPVPRSATAYNAMVDAALAHRRHEHDRLSGVLETPRDGDIIRLVNDTGTDLDRNSVVGIGGPIFTPSQSLDAFLREVALRGVVPTADHKGKFAILLDPAKDGRVIRAYVDGAVQVRVNVVDDTHTCAEVDPGNTAALVSSEDGSAQILWKEADDAYGYATGEQWAIIRFGSTCGGGTGSGKGTPDRCRCPEKDEPYEIEVDCGHCTEAYGHSVMPKFWILRVIGSTADPYGAPACPDHPCSDLINKEFRIKNEGAGAYGYSDSCTWSGQKICYHAELVVGPVNWTITITDENGCVLDILTKPTVDANCCGVNDGWTSDGSSPCNLTVHLAPDPCTCCPPDNLFCGDCPGEPPDKWRVVVPDFVSSGICAPEACAAFVGTFTLNFAPQEPEFPCYWSGSNGGVGGFLKYDGAAKVWHFEIGGGGQCYAAWELAASLFHCCEENVIPWVEGPCQGTTVTATPICKPPLCP